MHRAEGGEEISDCGNIGHKDSALEYITCQNPAEKHEGSREPWATEKAWLAWWQENKAKPQEQWIQEGLAQHGVTVHIPANAEDCEPLLALLGYTSTNRSDESYVPRYVKYNAFRWLRDSGFDPVGFAVSNITSQTPEIVKQGLFAYSKKLKLYPDLEGAGILSFGKQPTMADQLRRSAFFNASVQTKAYAVMLVPLVLGTILLLFSYRQMGRTNNATPKENSHRL